MDVKNLKEKRFIWDHGFRGLNSGSDAPEAATLWRKAAQFIACDKHKAEQSRAEQQRGRCQDHR